MTFRVEDQSKVFPRKVNIDLYRPLIDAAIKAPNGADGLPRVVIEEYETVKLATRAANAIRHHAKDNKLDLRVSSPKGSKTVCVFKSKPAKDRAPRKKAENPVAHPQATAEASSPAPMPAPHSAMPAAIHAVPTDSSAVPA
jgi:hypothetical protein